MSLLLSDRRKFLEQFFILLAIIVATYLAGKLRLSGLAEKSIWFDESFSILFAREQLAQTLHLCKNDVMPPLYFVLLHFWLRLFPARNMEIAIFYPRLLSAIFGILAIPLIYILGKRLFNPAVGILSVLLLTFSPFHLHYSQEIRMYSLFVVLALLEYIVIFDFIHRPSLKNYIFLVFLSVLLIYTHYFGFLLLA
ncbi:MAG: glycosyltransferase family 39 protein, partial [Candidatus Sumerlaeia bacterium]|nr:glycosyltransferase family 39 protein [Candidatus Sumerlaeia bacterium]